MYACCMVSAKSTIPICPKCGYDQSGEIATWESACPMMGLCPECGLEFGWAQVFGQLNEWGSEVDWYAEHAEGWISQIVRTPGTLLRLIFPLWYFKSMNHRRAIRLGMLARWMIVVFVLMHLLVSVVGFPANKAEYAWSSSGYGDHWTASFIDSICNTASAATFPFAAIVQYDNGAIELWYPFQYEEWQEFMMLSLVAVGVALCWTLLMGAVFLLRWRGDYDRRHELGLFGRVILLNLLPVIVYIELVRLGFGIHAATGMTRSTDWVPWMYLISLLVLIFWQQVLWTHSVRTIWEIKRSWVINIGGCFGSFIGGLIFAGWILM